MFRSFSLPALAAGFALALFAAPASAITYSPVSITPGGLQETLQPNTSYQYSSPNISAGSGIDDIFSFVYTPPPFIAGDSANAINDLAAINGTATWYYNPSVNNIADVGTVALVSGSSPGDGTDINFALPLPVAGGYFWYRFVGTAGNAGGQYNLTILTSAVPLPAAAWLFGSVLAGGIGVSRIRKRRKLAA
jgi:hypothetical protein